MSIEPQALLFADDGATPNNPRLPLLLYRGAVPTDGLRDPAAAFEAAFARHGWGGGWRNGIFAFEHFHLRAHEVLGIARGTARVAFGGARGATVELGPGDVAVLPAGVGHRRVSASADLLVVGAYPANGGDAAHATPSPAARVEDRAADRAAAIASVARVPLPEQDPVYGRDGPLTRLWRQPEER